MKALPCFMKDTTTFINKLNELTFESNTLLVMTDIIYLYPSQRITYAEALEMSKAKNPDQPDTKTLITLLEIVSRIICLNLWGVITAKITHLMNLVRFITALQEFTFVILINEDSYK